jgi:hypothetical protein
MLGRWAIPGFIFSIVLLLATAFLWVRSCFWSDHITYSWNHTIVGINTNEAGVTLEFGSGAVNRYNVGWRWMGRRDVHTGWRKFTAQTRIFDFGWQVFSRSNLRQNRISFPFWFPMLFMALAGWICFRARGKVRWAFRDDVRWSNPRLLNRIKRFLIFSTVGTVTGAAVGGLDVAFKLDHYRWGWASMALFPIPLIALLIFMTRRRISWTRAVLWMALEIAGMGCFFAATLEQFLYRFNAYGYEQPDTLAIALVFGVASFGSGAAVLLFLQLKPQMLKPGPYCPECGYCLIGSTSQRCAECGRPFTFEELGVLPGALALPARPK